MKYKVGDKLKVVDNISNHNFEKGEKIVIIGVGDINYRCEGLERKDECWWVCDEEVVLAEYDWEDFLKAPIGTKVTFERKEMLIKSKETLVQFKNTYYYRNYEELKGFEDNVGNKPLGKIIKIEEPTYTTVYEPKEEVTMPEIEEMKRLTDELYKTCDEFIKKMKENKDE